MRAKALLTFSIFLSIVFVNSAVLPRDDDSRTYIVQMVLWTSLAYVLVEFAINLIHVWLFGREAPKEQPEDAEQ